MASTNSPTPRPLLQLQGVCASFGDCPVLSGLHLDILPGLTAVTGDEGSGKTTLLRLLAGDLAPQTGTVPALDAFWLDLKLPDHDEATPMQVWQALRVRWPLWNERLQTKLSEALDLKPHLQKRLFMLSTGSRRKVGLVALLASGATLTCIDQPYAALDTASIRVLRDFLADMAHHPSRAWVVADHEADEALPWRHVVHLQ